MQAMRGIVIVCLAVVGVGISHAAPPYDPQKATTDAKSVNDKVKTYLGSPQGLQQNAQRPLTSNKQMLAYDGKEFNGQIACASPKPFIEMMIQPGATGDINIQSITQDTNLDGVMDAAYGLPTVVSGVCANGIISCTPGTWSACSAYRWGVDAGSRLTLDSVPLSSVGGCYCVNNHCGNNLVWNNLSTVMSDIAGGAIAAVIANKPSLAVADVRVDGPVIRYYSQQMGSCADPASTDPVQYMSSPVSIPGDSTAKANAAMAAAAPSTLPAASAFSEQMSSGVYQVIANSTIANSAATTTHDCQIKRQITMDEVKDDEILAYNGGTGGITSCGSGCFNLTLGQTGDNYLTGTCGLYRFDVSFWVLRPDRITNATLVSAQFDDHIQVSTNGELLWAHDAGWVDLSDDSYPPGTWWQDQWGFVQDTVYMCGFGNGDYPTLVECQASCVWGAQACQASQQNVWKIIKKIPWCERSTSWNINPNLNFTDKLKIVGPHDFKIRVGVADLGEGYAYAQVQVDNSCKLLPDVVDNQCAALETDTDCALQQETVDGVLTYSNYNPTGLVPLPSTNTISGVSCNIPTNRNWWQKNRRYICQENKNYDFTDALKRKANLDATATKNGYQDYRKGANGQWSFQDGAMALPATAPAGTCMTTCKARKPRALQPISGMGVADDLRNTTPSWDFVYHECDNNNCPLEAGEELVKACACINEFGEATAIMQGMRLSAKDMICTTGKSPTP